MQTKFKRHEVVRLLVNPDSEYIEYSADYDEKQSIIKKGMVGKINIILPNGQYHVEILDEKGEVIAYVPMPEEFLEKAE
jgi:hypothetical protein